MACVCVSVILKALEHLLKERKCEKLSASQTFNLNHMLSTLMSAVIQLMLNDNRPRTSRQEENYSSDRAIQAPICAYNSNTQTTRSFTLIAFFSLNASSFYPSYIYIISQSHRAFRKWHVLSLTVIINQGYTLKKKLYSCDWFSVHMSSWIIILIQ